MKKLNPAFHLKNFYVHVVLAMLVFAAAFIYTLLVFYGIAGYGEFDYAGILMGIVISLIFGMIRAFPFTVIDGKYGFYGAAIPGVAALLLFLLASAGDRTNVMIASFLAAAGIVFAAFYFKNVYNMLKKESLNDYTVLEYRTYKLSEINIMSMLMAAAYLFLMLQRGGAVTIAVIAAAGVAFAVAGKIYRTVKNKAVMKNIVWPTVLELVCLVISYFLILAQFYMHTINRHFEVFVAFMVLLFQLPGLILTVKVYREMKKFMYKD